MTASSPPVGPPVDATPAREPEPVTLAGRFGTVTRLNAARHGADLWQALRGHDDVWAYLPVGPFAEQGAFDTWLAASDRNTRPYYFYSILDTNGRAIGLASLMEIRPAQRVIEVGHITYSPALQRTPLGSEAQYLLMRYAFETLGYRRYEWKCNALNEPSRRAALRYGFKHEGEFRQHMIVKGRNRDTSWYSILDSEWPARKAAFERWLAPENIGPDGRQKSGLAALNGAAV
jgi:RimJ/RimL family protein N-acetyltransferase